MNLVVYDEQGSLIEVFSGSLGSMQDMVKHKSNAVLVGELPDIPSRLYYDTVTGSLLPKVKLPVKVEGNKLKELPLGTKVYIWATREEFEVLDGTFELVSNIPGNFKVSVDAPRHETVVLEMEVKDEG